MSKVKDFIADNNLQWQASFNNNTDKYAYGYRGSLIITRNAILACAIFLSSFEYSKKLFV